MIGYLQIEYWIRPDMTVMYPGNSSWFQTAIDGPAGWVVTLDGTMSIYNVEGDHFGFYYCIVKLSNGTDTAVKRALNYKVILYAISQS